MNAVTTAAVDPETPAKVTDLAVPAATQEASAKENDTPPPETPDKSDKDGEPATGEEKKAEGAAAPEEKPAEKQPSKLDRAREVARQRHREWQERVAIQAEAQRRAHEAARAREIAQQEHQRAQALQRQLEELRDPMAALAHLERVGLDAKTLTEKALAANTPEAKLRAELEAKLEERVSQVQRQYHEQIQRIESERQAALRDQQVRAAHDRFLNEAADTDSYPAVAHLVNLGPEWKSSLIREATQILQEAYRKTGEEYTNEEVLSFLNEKYSKLVTVTPKPKAEASKSKTASEPKKEAQNGPGSEETSQAGNPRTLTNKAAQMRGSLPPNWDDLPDAEQKKALAAMLRQMSRG